MGQVIQLGERLIVHRTPDACDVDRVNLKWKRQAAAAREHASLQRSKRFKRYAPWADRQAIKAIYQLAEKLTHETGIQHEVDHVIPLLGELVSGLHVETNLQAVPKIENRKKSNHYLP